MPYTRPDFDAADATFDGPAAYTLPAFDEADDTFFEGTPEALISIPGPLGAVEVMASGTAAGLISIAGPLGAVQVMAHAAAAGLISIPGPLGAVQIMVSSPTKALVSIPGPLGTVQVMGRADFSDVIDESAPVNFVLDVGGFRLPISNWGATLQTDGQCYLRCSIPAGELTSDEFDAINEATSFTITMQTESTDGTPLAFAYECAPTGDDVVQVQVDQGSVHYTVQMYGYTDAYPALEEPLVTRTMRGIQTLTTYPDSIRARCAVDWIMVPGNVATDGAAEFTVAYMNLYGIEGGGSYMDIGSRPPVV